MEEEELAEAAAISLLPKQGGSRPGLAPNKSRNRSLYGHLLYGDYWGINPVYNEKDFRRTFRMPRGLFDDIHNDVLNHDDYFRQKFDACKVKKLELVLLDSVYWSFRCLASLRCRNLSLLFECCRLVHPLGN